MSGARVSKTPQQRRALALASNSTVDVVNFRLLAGQWRRQNFSAAGAQPGHQNLD